MTSVIAMGDRETLCRLRLFASMTQEKKHPAPDDGGKKDELVEIDTPERNEIQSYEFKQESAKGVVHQVDDEDVAFLQPVTLFPPEP